VALVGVRIMALAFGVWCCRWVLLVIWICWITLLQALWLSTLLCANMATEKAMTARFVFATGLEWRRYCLLRTDSLPQQEARRLAKCFNLVYMLPCWRADGVWNDVERTVKHDLNCLCCLLVGTSVGKLWYPKLMGTVERGSASPRMNEGMTGRTKRHQTVSSTLSLVLADAENEWLKPTGTLSLLTTEWCAAFGGGL
jgi:hypothetical protein